MVEFGKDGMWGSGKCVDLLGGLEGRGGLLKKYQGSRWIENNSLIVKVIILHTIVDYKNI